MEKQIKVAVYEDNYALRESLTYLIKGSEMMQFAGAWGDCLDILKNCENERPDIIIMDIDMPYLSGIEATRLVKDAYPEINVMMLTVFEDREKIFDALCAGRARLPAKYSNFSPIPIRRIKTPTTSPYVSSTYSNGLSQETAIR